LEVQQLRLKYTPAQQEILFENTDAKFKVIPKGRRVGLTKGFCNGSIEWLLEGITPLLWVDTINGNIERYFERYFLPELKQLPTNWYKWDVQKKVLKIKDSIMDFRSADAPESIEGFGYKKIFLNEAGIILKNNYLYSNAILPMLLDYPDSQLIAAGVPKGKIKKDGTKHKFWELWESVLNNEPGYWGKTYSSYDNPLLRPEDIKQIEEEVSQAEASQEIFGQFIEISGSNPFAHQYNKQRHESNEAVLNKDRRLTISIDFNLDPFAVTFHHIWTDGKGSHHHIVMEKAINNGSLDAMIEYIKTNFGYWLPACQLTGDSNGNNRNLNMSDQRSFFTSLQLGLGLQKSQVNVPHDPTHATSRNDTNYFLLHYPDFKINPTLCPETCKDMIRVQSDAHGSIVKTDRNNISQRADFMDTVRYAINTFQKVWIENDRKRKK